MKHPQFWHFEVDELPDMDLSINRRRQLSKFEEAQLTKEEKEVWYARFLVLIPPEYRPPVPFEKCKITISLTFPEDRERDYDNIWAALKPLLDILTPGQAPNRRSDGYAGLGLIAKDSTKCIMEATLRVTSKLHLRETALFIEQVLR